MNNSINTEADDIFDDVKTEYDQVSHVTAPVIFENHLSPFQWLFENISIFGLETNRYFKRYFLKTLKFVLAPFKFIFSVVKFCIVYFLNFISNIFKNTVREARYLLNDFKVAVLLIKQNKSAHKFQKEKTPALLKKFFKITFEKHKVFIKRAVSYVLPVLMLIILFGVIDSYSELNFALDVTYNGIHLGYIENENVFRHAENNLKQRLEIGGQEYKSISTPAPEYKIAVVSLSEMSDANELCEQMILNSDSGLTTACGVYVDNKFIGSVKNEADASSVFKTYISDYCKTKGINENSPDVLVDLVENVSYIQGLYSENTLMDSDELKNYIYSNTKSEIKQTSTDTKISVNDFCKNYGISVDQFLSLNPKLNGTDTIEKNSIVNLIRNIPYLNVTLSKTITNVQEINFKTVEIKTDNLYQGITKVISPGEKGEKTVVTLETYLDGAKISSKEISSKITKNAKDKEVYVGTKPVPNNVAVFGANSGAFVWPVVNVKTVTSGFGYRYIFGGTSFHRGIDISGPGANGQPIIASAGGTVEKVTSGSTGYGYSVLINHGNGIKTRYAHCQAGSICVKAGQSVVQGQMIARVGSTGNSTGPHLHFEIIYNGSYANPLNYLTR